MSQQSFSFSGNIPQQYDQYLGPYIFEPYAIDLVSRIKKHYSRVLEIAAGTGRVTRHLVNKLDDDTEIIATDLNPDMLGIAMKSIVANNIEWQIADAMQLPFVSENFDLVLCQFGFMFLPDKQKGFDEVYRVLESGGKFFCSTWDKIENNPATEIVRKAVAGYFTNDPPQFYYIPFSMYDPDELRTYLKKAGFRKINIERVNLTGESPTALNIATGFIEGNPVIHELLKNGNTNIEDIKQAAAAAIRKQFGDNPVRSPLSAWVCSGIK